MRYILDTNILSDLVRHPQGLIARHIERVGEDQIATSVIVAAELRFGVAKLGAARLAAQVETVLGPMVVLPFETPADRVYGAIRASLERAGTPISANDLFIAAHAVTLGLTLITANEKEFSRVAGLNCENWLVPGRL
jgi:tRNA(fMet)-specific endonuclease VapC